MAHGNVILFIKTSTSDILKTSSYICIKYFIFTVWSPYTFFSTSEFQHKRYIRDHPIALLNKSRFVALYLTRVVMQYEKMIRMLKFLENLMIMGVSHVYSFTTEVSTTWKLKSSFALNYIHLWVNLIEVLKPKKLYKPGYACRLQPGGLKYGLIENPKARKKTRATWKSVYFFIMQCCTRYRYESYVYILFRKNKWIIYYYLRTVSIYYVHCMFYLINSKLLSVLL